MKNIVRVRIDERLIHGQVALAWSSMFQTTRFMVIDDEVAKDSFQVKLLKMVCPSGVKLSVLPVSEAANNLLADKYPTDRIFVLVKRPETLLHLWDAGVHIESVNVGNMSGRENSILIRKGLCVTQENVQAFRKLNDKGVKLTAQMVPSDPEADLIPLLEKAK